MQKIRAPVSILSILQSCIVKKDFDTGRRVSDLLTKFGADEDPYLGTHLIRLFALGGSLGEALKVFHHLSQQSTFSWSAIISAHAKLGQDMEALALYAQMAKTDLPVDAHTLVAVLTACSHANTSDFGMLVHSHATQDGHDFSLFVGNSLVSMYAKRGSFDDACRVFDTLPGRDLVSFGALISGYVLHGLGEDAVRLFLIMQEESMVPDEFITVNVVSACSNSRDLFTGKAIHATSTKKDSFLQSALICMYACCGSIIKAREVFDKILHPCLVTLNAIMSGYVQHGHGNEALALFTKMTNKRIGLDVTSYLCLVQAGACIGDLEIAHIIHIHILESCDKNNLLVDNSLIDMYAKCSCLEAVGNAFNRIKERTVVTWNVLIAACAQLGSGQEAFQHYERMLQSGANPDSSTFVAMIKASLKFPSVLQGHIIHSILMERNHEKELLVGNTLVDMYVKRGQTEDACRVFIDLRKRDVVSWTVLIKGFARCNRYDKVIQYFAGMQKEGVEPNGVTFLCILSACNHLGLVDEGRSNFKMMKEVFKLEPTLEHYHCLVDLLARSGLFDEAHEIIRTMPSMFTNVARKTLFNKCAFHHKTTDGLGCFTRLVC
ncbi:hypothetical protein L7F22_029066 [Adiantum nelumboides]|nr:hypothetical protein [Adiantum nelumboides]